MISPKVSMPRPDCARTREVGAGSEEAEEAEEAEEVGEIGNVDAAHCQELSRSGCASFYTPQVSIVFEREKQTDLCGIKRLCLTRTCLELSGTA